MDFGNLTGQQPVGLAPGALGTTKPVVIAASGDLEHAAQNRHRVVFLMTPDERYLTSGLWKRWPLLFLKYHAPSAAARSHAAAAGASRPRSVDAPCREGILGPLRILPNPLVHGVRMDAQIRGDLGLAVASLGYQLHSLDLELTRKGRLPDTMTVLLVLA